MMSVIVSDSVVSDLMVSGSGRHRRMNMANAMAGLMIVGGTVVGSMVVGSGNMDELMWLM